jgi:hypothetical protein
LAITSDDKSAEAEAPSAFDYFGGAIDENDLFNQVIPPGISIRVGTPATSGPLTPIIAIRAP